MPARKQRENQLRKPAARLAPQATAYPIGTGAHDRGSIVRKDTGHGGQVEQALSHRPYRRPDFRRALHGGVGVTHAASMMLAALPPQRKRPPSRGGRALQPPKHRPVASPAERLINQHASGSENITASPTNCSGVSILFPARADALPARAEAAPAALLTWLLLNERSGKPWATYAFVHTFAEIRATAAQGMPEVANQWFMELRHTGITRQHESGVEDLGISGVTGHPQERQSRARPALPRSHGKDGHVHSGSEFRPRRKTGKGPVPGPFHCRWNRQLER